MRVRWYVVVGREAGKSDQAMPEPTMISSSVMFISFTLLNRMFPDPCVTMCSIVSWRTKLDNFPKRFAPRRHCTRWHSELTYVTRVAHEHTCLTCALTSIGELALPPSNGVTKAVYGKWVAGSTRFMYCACFNSARPSVQAC